MAMALSNVEATAMSSAGGLQAPPATPNETPESVQVRAVDRLSTLPYWLIFLLLVGVLLVYLFSTSETYVTALTRILGAIWVTIFVTAVSFTLALIIGLLAGL